MKPKGNNRQRAKPNFHEQSSKEYTKNSYQVARAEINFVNNRVQELTQLARGAKGIEDAIRRSHISSTLEYATRDFDSVRRIQNFAADLQDKLFKLEQEIVCSCNRQAWARDVRLIFVYEATVLVQYSKRLDEASLSASHNELVLTRKDATTHYVLGRDGLDACAIDILHCESEDEQRRERTIEVHDKEGFSSYVTANTRAKHLIARERFDEMARSVSIAAIPKTSGKSKGKGKRRK